MKKVVLCLFVFLCSCGTSQPTNFYALTSTQKSDTDAVYSLKDKIVAVDPVVIPAYLQRPQIVTKETGGVEVRVNEFNRWIEPLSESTQRLLVENLSFYMKNSFVKNTVSNRMPYDYRVYVEINKIDAKLGDRMLFSATWTVADKKNKALINERTVYDVEIGSSYEAMARKQSELLNNLSRDIAQKMKTLK